MKSLSFTLCFFLLGSVVLATPPFPKILEMHGKVKWTDKDGKEAAAKAPQILIEKAALQTEAGSEVRVQIDAHRELLLQANSRLELPAISWETGEAPVLILKYGSFRWKQEPGKAYNIALRSDLFEFLSPVGDFVFSYDPKKAFAEVKALKGQMEFSAMNAEDVALVTEGQKVSFQGVIENSEVVYDVLLKGKKIPRGKLGLVQAFSDEDKKQYSAAAIKKAEAARHKKEAGEAKLQNRPREASQICDKPWGKLNQCAWVCENNPAKEKKACRLDLAEVKCLRRRCNANGEWAESTEIPKEKAASLCGLQPLVKECDY